MLPAPLYGEKGPNFGFLSFCVLHGDLPARKREKTFPFFIGRKVENISALAPLFFP
jgi:hypothetical protein